MSGTIFQYYRDQTASNNNGAITDFADNNATDSFKLKEKKQAGNDCRKNVEIMVPLKYTSNFLRTLEIPLILKIIVC